MRAQVQLSLGSERICYHQGKNAPFRGHYATNNPVYCSELNTNRKPLGMFGKAPRSHLLTWK